MIVHIDFPIRIFNFPWKLQQVGFTLVRFSCIRYLSNKHCTALVAMPKWDLASETMIKTIKGEVVCCPCKLQAAVVSAMVSNTCPALTTEYTEYWTDRLLDQWVDFGKEFIQRFIQCSAVIFNICVSSPIFPNSRLCHYPRPDPLLGGGRKAATRKNTLVGV